MTAQATFTDTDLFVVGSVFVSAIQPMVRMVVTERTKTDAGYKYAGYLAIEGEKVAEFSNWGLADNPDWLLESEPCDCGDCAQ
jgi:hypothetical protein